MRTKIVYILVMTLLITTAISATSIVSIGNKPVEASIGIEESEKSFDKSLSTQIPSGECIKIDNNLKMKSNLNTPPSGWQTIQFGPHPPVFHETTLYGCPPPAGFLADQTTDHYPAGLKEFFYREYDEPSFEEWFDIIGCISYNLHPDDMITPGVIMTHSTYGTYSAFDLATRLTGSSTNCTPFWYHDFVNPVHGDTRGFMSWGCNFINTILGQNIYDLSHITGLGFLISDTNGDPTIGLSSDPWSGFMISNVHEDWAGNYNSTIFMGFLSMNFKGEGCFDLNSQQFVLKLDDFWYFGMLTGGALWGHYYPSHPDPTKAFVAMAGQINTFNQISSGRSALTHSTFGTCGHQIRGFILTLPITGFSSNSAHIRFYYS